MRRFAALFRALDRTTGTNAKIDAMTRYFEAAPPEDAIHAVVLLAGRRRRRVLTSRDLRRHFQAHSGMPPWLLEQSHAHVGDTAETITLLLRSSDLLADTEPDDPLELPLHVWMEREIPRVAALDDEFDEREILLGWWRRVPRDQLFVLNKVLTGGFRVGVSQKSVVRALAKVSGVPAARITHRMMGTLEPTAATFARLVSEDDGTIPPSQPYPFMLAHDLEDGRLEGEPAGTWTAEWKWDGIRGQILRRAGGVYIWSRGEDLVTGQFPELAEAAAALPDGTVLDGEIAAWDEDAAQPLTFNHLQPRLGRKTVPASLRAKHPVRFLAYDLLELDGADVRGLPLHARQESLATLLDAAADPRLQPPEVTAVDDAASLEALRARARDLGAEGLMIKRRDGPYLVGRTVGHWWKHKTEPFTLDAVLVYAHPGSGRRANLFTDFTFALWDDGELVTFTKAYAGLTDDEFRELSRWVRRHTVERFGPVRRVEPEHVFELAFEGIRESNRHKSGVAVRFPRMLRWRRDKAAREANTLADARAILAKVS